MVVATVAFGMGVDMSCLGAVIHLTMPRSLEDYVQQVWGWLKCGVCGYELPGGRHPPDHAAQPGGLCTAGVGVVEVWGVWI